MKSPRFFLCALLLSLFFLVSACQDEKENKKGDYSGVSKLIADRNKARYAEAAKTIEKSVGAKKRTIAKADTVKSQSASKKENLASIILYEEDVKIVGSKSGRILAKGVAYINKKGQIVRIKILRE